MSEKARDKVLIWAILDSEQEIELYAGTLPPILDGDITAARHGTRLFGQTALPGSGAYAPFSAPKKRPTHQSRNELWAEAWDVSPR
jgi:hypothetical protein